MKLATFTDPRDGNAYRTVRIGAQCWLAENLKVLPAVCPATTSPDGSPQCFVYDYQGRDVDEAKAAANYRHYGVLYNWAAALAASPPGWHLPSDAEWTELTDGLIRTHRHLAVSNVGVALKSRRQAGTPPDGGNDPAAHPRWDRPPACAPGDLAARCRGLAQRFMGGATTGCGTDASGFSALPGGRATYGCFCRLGHLGYWWSSTAASPLRVWARQMTPGGTVNRWDMSKDYGYSIRCIRD